MSYYVNSTSSFGVWNDLSSMPSLIARQSSISLVLAIIFEMCEERFEERTERKKERLMCIEERNLTEREKLQGRVSEELPISLHAFLEEITDFYKSKLQDSHYRSLVLCFLFLIFCLQFRWLS